MKTAWLSGPLAVAVVSLFPGALLAQDDPFSGLGQAAPAPLSSACDLVVAHDAAVSFHIFTAVIVLLAAVASTGVWYLLERRTIGFPLVRFLLAGLASGLTAFVLLAWNPLASATTKTLMATPSCQVEFALGPLYPWGQALVLAFVPALILGFIASMVANRVAS